MKDAAAAGIEDIVLLTETDEAIFRTLDYAAIDRGAVDDPSKHGAQ